MENFCDNAIPEQLLADAGYDSEANHELLREYLGIDSIIPPKSGRPTEKLPAGKWRRELALNLDDEAFGQRWQCETTMFMLKQHQGDALTARSYQTRRREMGLMCVSHNLMIVYARRGFLQGTSGLFLCAAMVLHPATLCGFHSAIVNRLAVPPLDVLSMFSIEVAYALTLTNQRIAYPSVFERLIDGEWGNGVFVLLVLATGWVAIGGKRWWYHNKKRREIHRIGREVASLPPTSVADLGG